jgi:hypothetical protein
LPFERLKLPVPAGRQQRPRILAVARERLRKLISAPASLPELDQAFNSLNCRNRKRLERRTSLVAMLDAMLDAMDLVSMRVGTPRLGGTFLDFDLNFLAARAGLTAACMEGAWHDARALGLVTSRIQCKLAGADEGGGHRGVASVKCISGKLFEWLRLGPWLTEERRKATGRKAEKEAGRARRTSRGMPRYPGQRRSAPRPGTTDQPGTSDWRTRTATILLAGQIRINHPGWDRETCLQAAREQIAQQSRTANPSP